MRRIPVILAAAAFLLAGCTSGGAASSGQSGSPPAAPGTIVIKNFGFNPADLTVPPGTTVTVVNEDQTTHTVTSTATPPAFNTGDIGPGKTVTFIAPSTKGTYPYICFIHQYMQGTLTVS